MSVGSQSTSRAGDRKQGLSCSKDPPQKHREPTQTRLRGKGAFSLKHDHMSSKSLLTLKNDPGLVKNDNRTDVICRILSWAEFDSQSSAYTGAPTQVSEVLTLWKFSILNPSLVDGFYPEKPRNFKFEYQGQAPSFSREDKTINHLL